ncbi:hypothetical protein U1701_00405 [Sphingomonas sp. PB2P19]|uniref:hypothetical protein n=1 Tax=Sphingomonas rhamnosi TaxID=3096156 RepID=UPI002FC6A9AB
MKGFVLAVAVLVGSAASVGARAQEAAPAREVTRNAGPADMEESRIERVTADLSGAIGTWTGVRSCGRAERANDERQSAYERWIGQQTLARPRKLLLVAGVGAGRWRYENRRRSSGARHCKGWYVSAPVYAHFY